MMLMYALAAVAALGLMFVFPLAPLFMLFGGLASLGIVVGISACTRGLQRLLGRRSLESGVCPQCSKGLSARPVPGASKVTCANCGAAFEASGAEIEQMPA
jgi:hypothetical protein